MIIAVSECLLGAPCRYDGAAKPCAEVLRLRDLPFCELLPLCPEVLGGLGTPRPPSEVQTARFERTGELVVLNSCGEEVTEAFVRGAEAALARIREAGCTFAILKSKSPSCGNGLIYDGSFTGALAEGPGVTARLLRENGVRIVDEEEFAELLAANEGALGQPGFPPALLDG